LEIKHNDLTNAFKAYRRTTIDGCRPFDRTAFNLTVEIPLKAVFRAYTWTSIPITWRNRRSGRAKFKIKKWAAAISSSAFIFGWRSTSVAEIISRKQTCERNRGRAR